MDNENPNIRPLDKKGLELVWELSKAKFMNAQTASAVMQSLQSQIDSIASKDSFDELKVSVLTADIIAAQKAYAQTFIGELQGTATTAGNYTAGGGIATALGTKFDKAGGEISGDITLDTDNTRSIGTNQKRLASISVVNIGCTKISADSVKLGNTKIVEAPDMASGYYGVSLINEADTVKPLYIAGNNSEVSIAHGTDNNTFAWLTLYANGKIELGGAGSLRMSVENSGNVKVMNGLEAYGGVAAYGISDLTTMF